MNGGTHEARVESQEGAAADARRLALLFTIVLPVIFTVFLACSSPTRMIRAVCPALADPDGSPPLRGWSELSEALCLN